MSTEASTINYSPDEDEPLSVAIVTALSKAKGRDITEHDCVLYDNIDPEALDEMFREEGTDGSIKVEFATHDAIVLIWGSGDVTIQIQDLEDDPNHN